MRPNTTARVLLAALAGLLVTSGVARAQFVQYTRPGSLSEVTKPRAEAAKENSESARWKIGEIRLDPRFELRDFGYYDNVFASPEETTIVEDVRGTAAAGIAAFLDLGAKSLLTGYVAPEYSWWRDQDELSELSVNWGAGWFGLFNNMTATANVSRSEQERPLSDEVDAPARVEDERQELRVELRLTDAFTIVAGATSSETRYDDGLDPFVPELTASTLDRDDEMLLLGAYLSIRDWEIGAGVESTEVDLIVDPEGRSNSGDSPFARIAYSAGRIDFELTGIDREVEFVNPELELGAFTAGSGRLGLELNRSTLLTVYGARSLALAAIDTSSIVEQDRQGVSMVSEFGDRFELTLLAETGESIFRDGGGANRRDDLESWAATLRWKVRGRLYLTLNAGESTWNSDLDEFDRTQRSFGVGFDLGNDLFPW